MGILRKYLSIIVSICLVPSICFASWNAYITGGRTKYCPNDTIPTTTSLTVNAVKGQFAAWQIPLKIDGEDVTTITATCTTPTKGGDTLTIPLIYKAYNHNIIIPSRANNLGGVGTNLGNPIGEIPDALIPKVDSYYSGTRNAFPFSMNRISPVYAFPVILITGGATSSVVANNTASNLPTVAGTYSGSGLNNYHIIIDGAGAKGVATFKWSTSSFNIKRATWVSSTQIATITTYQPHGFSVSDTVRIKTSRNTFNGSFTIASVPSTTTFTYSVAGVYSGNIYYDGGGTTIKTWNASTVTTGDAIALNNGLTITFPVQTYAVGDEWEFYVNNSRVETLWMESYIPTDAVAGTYTSTITITANGKSDITLNLSIVVYNLAIGKEPTIPIRYASQVDSPIRGHFDTLWFDYNTSSHRELIKRYIESALRHRMTVHIKPNMYYAGDNLSITDWESIHKPWFTLYLNGTWTQGVAPTGLKWSTFFNTNPPIMVNNYTVDSDLDYNAAEKTRLATFASLFDAEGWMTTYKPYIFVAEEPKVYTGTAETAIQNAYDSMKAINSNYRAVATKRLVTEGAWVGHINVWNTGVLQFGTYPRSIYNDEITAGNELWSYVACDGKGCGIVGPSFTDQNISYNIDGPMTEMIGAWWLMYDNDVRGDLYYQAIEAQSHYTYYPGKVKQDFWDIQLNYGGNGEGTFWYPGRVSAGGHPIGGDANTDIPIESLRLKAWRMGQEDYEIFKLTSRSTNSLAQVESAVGTGKWKFTSGLPTEANMETARTNILNELLGQPPPSVVPTVTTTAISNITTTTASSGGNVLDAGGGTVSARGVCWSTSINPTTADSKTTDGSGVGVFTSSITGLASGTPYYTRAYATNEVGTSYGSNIQFTSLGITTVTIAPGSLASAGSTFNRGDFTTTNAFFWSSLDLSPYAGTDLGSTPYYIEVLDGAGKEATGYLGAVGAGETLGSELITSWNDATLPYDTFTTSGKDITSAITATAGVARSNQATLAPNSLVKMVTNILLFSGAGPLLYDLGMTPTLFLGGIGSDQIFYYNFFSGTGPYYQFYNPSATNWSTVNSSKRITDPPSTAVHIVSSLNGTTRNWASIESGFDPNTIASWAITGGSQTIAIGTGSLTLSW